MYHGAARTCWDGRLGAHDCLSELEAMLERLGAGLTKGADFVSWNPRSLVSWDLRERARGLQCIASP